MISVALEELLVASHSGYWGRDPDDAGQIVRVIRNGDLKPGKGLIGTYAARSFTAAEVEKSRLFAGDLVITTSGDCGVTGYVGTHPEEPTCASNFIRILRPDVSRVHPKYLFHFTRSQSFRSALAPYIRGTTLKNLSTKAAMAATRVPLPPLEEQRRIADILDHADRIKDAARQAVVAADGYALALYHEMFSTFPTSLMLGDVCKRITDGTHQSPGWAPSGVPFLFVSNITSGEIDLHTAKFISHETWTELTRRTPIEVGDVLYSTVGTFGIPAVVRTSEPFAFQRHIAHLKPDGSAVNSDFLATQLATSSVRSQAKRLARGVAQPTVNLSDLARIRIAAPPLEMQTEFAERIGMARGVRAKLTTQLRLVEDLGASLSSRAFRGGL